MACPVLLSTTTRPDICEPAVIVRDDRTIRADSDAAGAVVCGLVADCVAAPLAHPVTAASNASSTTLDLIDLIYRPPTYLTLLGHVWFQ